jgi:hypothetical protein
MIMMKTRKFSLCLLLSLFFLTGFQIAWLSPARGEKTVPTKMSEVPRITPEQLKSLLDRGVKVVIVDARSDEEYTEAHIPGALSMGEFNSRRQQFSKDTKVVLY